MQTLDSLLTLAARHVPRSSLLDGKPPGDGCTVTPLWNDHSGNFSTSS